jgi:hypothetical protein
VVAAAAAAVTYRFLVNQMEKETEERFCLLVTGLVMKVGTGCIQLETDISFYYIQLSLGLSALSSRDCTGK